MGSVQSGEGGPDALSLAGDGSAENTPAPKPGLPTVPVRQTPVDAWMDLLQRDGRIEFGDARGSLEEILKDMNASRAGDVATAVNDQSKLAAVLQDHHGQLIAPLWAMIERMQLAPADLLWPEYLSGEPIAPALGGKEQPIAEFLSAVGAQTVEQTAALVEEFKDMEAELVGDVEELLAEKEDLELFVEEDQAALDTIWAAFEKAWGRDPEPAAAPAPAPEPAPAPSDPARSVSAPASTTTPAPAPAPPAPLPSPTPPVETAPAAPADGGSGEVAGDTDVGEWLSKLLPAEGFEEVVAELNDMRVLTVKSFPNRMMLLYPSCVPIL